MNTSPALNTVRFIRPCNDQLTALTMILSEHSMINLSFLVDVCIEDADRVRLTVAAGIGTRRRYAAYMERPHADSMVFRVMACGEVRGYIVHCFADTEPSHFIAVAV